MNKTLSFILPCLLCLSACTPANTSIVSNTESSVALPDNFDREDFKKRDCSNHPALDEYCEIYLRMYIGSLNRAAILELNPVQKSNNQVLGDPWSAQLMILEYPTQQDVQNYLDPTFPKMQRALPVRKTESGMLEFANEDDVKSFIAQSFEPTFTTISINGSDVLTTATPEGVRYLAQKGRFLLMTGTESPESEQVVRGMIADFLSN